MDIKDKVIIITGASAGIGLATARRSAKEGAKLVLAARSVDKLQELARDLENQGVEVLPVQTDMRDPASVEQMVQAVVRRFGHVDVLINNAGQAVAGTVADLNLDAFRQVFELNIMGVLYAMQAVIPEMRKNGGGLIANVSSMVSKMNIPGLSGYAATKSALNMFTQTARAELAGDNIRVMTIFPRMTATDFGKNSIGNRTMREQQRAGHSTGPATGHTNSPASGQTTDPATGHTNGPADGQGFEPPAMRSSPVIDSADHVAERIIQAIQTEPAEQYME